MASLCHPWLTTTNLSYRFPIFETSATALCGTTGISTYHYTTQCAWTPYLSFERHETFRECEIASVSTMPGMHLVRTLKYLRRSTWTVWSCNRTIARAICTRTDQRLQATANHTFNHMQRNKLMSYGPMRNSAATWQNSTAVRCQLITYHGQYAWPCKCSNAWHQLRTHLMPAE